jgi:RNA polymerase sigma-70 factor (ECF subfamily)
MNDQERHALFSEQLTRCQSQVYGYIFGVVRNWQDADDVYQSVCLILWRKFETFEPGSNFLAWARQTTKIELSQFLRQRPSLCSVDETLLDDLVEPFVESHGGEAEPYLAALRHCKTKLNPADEDLLELHYSEDLGSREIAARLQRSQPSICRSLNRIRSWLLQCVQMELARQEHPGGEQP